MDILTATVSTKGQLVIPAEMRSALGIETGTRVSLRIENDTIVIQPVSIKTIDEMRGMFASGPSLEDELMKGRRSEKW